MSGEKKLAKVVTDVIQSWSEQMPAKQLRKLKNDLWLVANEARSAERERLGEEEFSEDVLQTRNDAERKKFVSEG
jgi:hypothetical protein